MRRHSIVVMLASISATYLASAQGDAGTARRLAPSGELRAALIASNPVLVTKLKGGELAGVSVDLARALGEKLGVTVRLMPYENPAHYNQSSAKTNGTSAWRLVTRPERSTSHSAHPSWRSITVTLLGPDWR